MTECYSSIEMVMRYYGNETHEGAQMPFNFQFIERIKMESDANDYKAAIDYWWTNMPEGRTANWVVINHFAILFSYEKLKPISSYRWGITIKTE